MEIGILHVKRSRRPILNRTFDGNAFPLLPLRKVNDKDVLQPNRSSDITFISNIYSYFILKKINTKEPIDLTRIVHLAMPPCYT